MYLLFITKKAIFHIKKTYIDWKFSFLASDFYTPLNEKKKKILKLKMKVDTE